MAWMRRRTWLTALWFIFFHTSVWVWKRARTISANGVNHLSTRSNECVGDRVSVTLKPFVEPGHIAEKTVCGRIKSAYNWTSDKMRLILFWWNDLVLFKCRVIHKFLFFFFAKLLISNLYLSSRYGMIHVLSTGFWWGPNIRKICTEIIFMSLYSNAKILFYSRQSKWF